MFRLTAYLFLFLPFVSQGYEIDKIIIQDPDGKVLDTVIDATEVEALVKLLKTPDHNYRRSSEPFSLPATFVWMIFLEGEEIVGVANIMIHDSMVMTQKATWDAFKKVVFSKETTLLGTNKGLTGAVIDRMERKCPDYLDKLDPVFGLNKENLRKKAKLTKVKQP